MSKSRKTFVTSSSIWPLPVAVTLTLVSRRHPSQARRVEGVEFERVTGDGHELYFSGGLRLRRAMNAA